MNPFYLPTNQKSKIRNQKFLTIFYILVGFLFTVTGFSQLDETWTLSANGRSVQANADGSFTIRNIPARDDFGDAGPGSPRDGKGDNFIRLVGTRTVGGITEYLFTDPFQILSGETITILPEELTSSTTPPPLPKLIRASAPQTLLTTVGETTQLTVTATLADDSTLDITTKSTWTSYTSSNPEILTVGPDGLVQAEAEPGTAFITAENGQAISVVRINYVPADPLTTVEGFVQFSDNSPAVNAEVRITEIGAETTTGADGFFSIPNVPTTLSLSITAVALGSLTTPTLTGGVVDIDLMPALLSDVGIIHLSALTSLDSDGDGLSDDLELLVGLDPNDEDTDGDGTLDGDEDADSDQLADAWEIFLGTDPQIVDTDGDGVFDRDEDADGDGLTNVAEIGLGIDPLDLNTDNDAWPDGAEVDFNGDPLDSAVIPQLFYAGSSPAVTSVILEDAISGTANLNTIAGNPDATITILEDTISGTTDLNTISGNPPVQIEILQ